MMSKSIIVAALVAYTEARFGQEQVPVSAVSSLSNFGNPGEAATLAGGIPGSLLAAANPCDKLTLADKIVTQLGTDPSVIDAAKGLVAAEQNFNPFVVSIPSICSDATLPATAELRGVVPLIDPAVTGSDTENANSKTSLTTPFDANGLSVAEIMAAQGFSNLTAVAADGTKAAAGGAAAGAATGAASGANGNAASGAAGNATADASNGNANAGAGGKKSCSSKGKGKGSNNNNNNNNNAGANANNNNGNNNGAAANNNAGAAAAANNGTAAATGGQTSLAGADFGKCTPTMDFQFGRAGRKATEGTFLPTDALVAQGQQDALNPNIITNRICDQLTNVCEANQAAKDACQSAKAQIQALGTKDATTATAFNQALGF
ncbi:hypothetical protein INS49_003753 [Diaporthe citri]|uniref:uncharacterized protein n=1 Tax=Diaporthe citri TaxID=83186 RepID=UPI001C7E5AB4|nr:uncharacterized protein INS49_003753 [Diaporthe citri]KAG6355787.1 hypothetical protein INS49_003753 [Diaporthe citri]